MRRIPLLAGSLFCLALVINWLNPLVAGSRRNMPVWRPFPDPLAQPADTIPDGGLQQPISLPDPSIVKKEVEYDPETGQYIFLEKIGDDYFRPPTFMNFDEYMEYRARQQEQQVWRELAGLHAGERSRSGRPDPIAKVDLENNLVDRLFGGTTVDIRPQGNIDLTFGVDYQNVQNPVWTLRQQRQGGFDFDMAIQMNVQGQIGEKLKLSTNYNTQATFDFDNQMKLDYSSDAFSEDDIIKKIEAGNVSLPLRGQLIQGSQSLFGLKTELQFGRLRLTAVASQQKSEREEITIQGGSQFQEFEVRADQYDENRHFFLTHYNRAHFEEALEALPQVKTLFRIENIQVWVTNDRNETVNVRDIVAIADLGEPERMTNTNPAYQAPPVPRFRDLEGHALPDNFANDIYADLLADPRNKYIDRAANLLKSAPFNFQQGRDFEKVSARKLSPTEYTYHPELGFISLNINLQPDQVLAVAFQYSYKDSVYQVGQLAEDVPATSDSINQNVLFVKMLKSSTQRVDVPTWDLMMKNVYSIGAFQVSSEDFRLDIYYEDPGGGLKRFLPETNLAGIPLLQVFNLDQLNSLNDPQPDGVFDFVPGLTINPANGRIMFPVLEPFGEALARKIDDPVLRRKYVYDTLYSAPLVIAQEFAEFNRFTIKGSYKSSVSREISLGAFNIPQGSVRVTAGGQVLRENIDYEVDYNLGRVRILNDAYLNSGQPIRVSFEDNTLFGFQTKTMLGLRADYQLNKHLTLGGTYLHLFERPYTPKVNVGDDPINNRIFGLDLNYSNQAPWLTRAIDALPLIQTKEPSQVTFFAEAAFLKPGYARAIQEGEKGERQSVVYIDDFEGAISSFDLRTPTNAWQLASVPQNDAQNNNPLFPEAEAIDTTLAGVNRALLNWYRIDPSVARGVTDNPYEVLVPQTEVFPNFTPTDLLSATLYTFDLSYYPDERGPYNFDLPATLGGTPYSAGLRPDGKLAAPETRWGGIMRALTTNDFQQANIEFLEFWVLSPFLDEAGTGQGAPNAAERQGTLYIELGNISEDILRDSRKFFENGLPGPNNSGRKTARTAWGRVPLTQQITNAFDNDPETRRAQDVGLDGLANPEEQQHFKWYLDALQAGGVLAQVIDSITMDPSNDDFKYFRDADYDNTGASVRARYKRFNGLEGNSQPPTTGQFISSSTNYPDNEDLNRDNSLNESESYFQYRIPIEWDGDRGIKMEGNPFVTERVVSDDGKRVWYRFKVPLDLPDDHPFFKRVGGIQDFRSIRFMRMYLRDFRAPVTFRFARLELVRNQWRRYRQPLAETGINGPTEENAATLFDVNALNIEENSQRQPFGYTLPPGIRREQALGLQLNALQNEQSMAMTVCGLEDGDARAIYKIINLDMRFYERLRMFVHGELRPEDPDLKDGELTVFIRLGSDFTRNYYEYELPLKISRDSFVPYNDPNYPRVVWPLENEFDFSLNLLKSIKLQRNAEGYPLSKVYPLEGAPDPDRPDARVRIKGNPNLGLVKGVMIGIRNPKDDGKDHCVEVWVNELRLAGLEQRGGMAALARLDMQLADLGNLTLAGNMSTIGYGALDQQLYERSREDVVEYSVAADLNLGKFLPKEWGVQVPFLAQVSQSIRTPQYDPYDLDVEVSEKIAGKSGPERDSILDLSRQVTSLRSVNFTNVRKERTHTDRNPLPWDISNFQLTYVWEEGERRDPFIEYDRLRRQRGVLTYNFSRKGGFVEPLKKLSDSQWLGLITHFNFNPLPNSFGFQTELNRQFQETKYRFAGDNPFYNTFFIKRFTWDRSYDLTWDLSKNIKLRFFADNRSVVDELPEFDPETTLPIPAAVKREFLLDNLRKLGRPKQYKHTLTLNYTAPLKQFPLLEWVNATASYTANYQWDAASETPGARALGNVIQNRQRRQANIDLDFEKLYNRSKYLKAINTRARRRGGRSGMGTTRRPSGRSSEGARAQADEQARQGREKKKKQSGPSKMERALVRPLLFLRKARLSWTEDFATVVPGYMPTARFLGMDRFTSPGWDFIFGLQPKIDQASYYGPDDWLYRNWSWISGDQLLNQQVIQNYSNEVSAKITIEPIPDFRINIDATRSFSNNHTEFFRRDTIFQSPDQRYQQEWRHLIPRDIGSFSLTWSGLSTLFNDDIIGLFERFEDNRLVISQRLGTGYHLDSLQRLEGYTNGFGRYQQSVLLPAFIAAYTGLDPTSMELDPDYTRVLFRQLPRLNWRVSYNGLARLPGLRDIFQSVTINHAYASRLNVNTFESDLNYDFNDPFKRNPVTQDFYARFELPNVVIDERFSPLLGLDIRTKQGMSFNLDFKRARTLQMSFIDYSLNETRSKEYVVGFGYRMKNVDLPFGKKKKKRRPSTQDNPIFGNNNARRGVGEAKDLDISFDFSLRDDVTIRHQLDQDIREPTRGTNALTISPAAEYRLNRQLSLRFFVDYRRTVPKTSQGYPTTNVNGGVTVRFTLQ